MDYLLERVLPQAAEALGEAFAGDRPDVLGQGEADRFQTSLGRVDTDVDGGATIGPGEGNGDAHLAAARGDLIDRDDHHRSPAALLVPDDGLQTGFPHLPLLPTWDRGHYRSFKPSSSVPSQALSSDR